MVEKGDVRFYEKLDSAFRGKDRTVTIKEKGRRVVCLRGLS
jgi:hypothetical protein